MNTNQQESDNISNDTTDLLRNQSLNQTLPRIEPLLTDSKFIKERLDDQINWFNSNSAISKKQYRFYTFLEILLAGLIPMALSLSEMHVFGDNDFGKGFDICMKIYIAAGGSAIVVINKYLEINAFKDSWITYRITCELLRAEKYKYLSKADPYDENDAFPLLVNNVDLILSRGNENWARIEKTVKNKTEVYDEENATEVNKNEGV
jgi:hypothetical protein